MLLTKMKSLDKTFNFTTNLGYTLFSLTAVFSFLDF